MIADETLRSPVLILGGVRSGKSGFALELGSKWAQPQGRQKIFVATAEPSDPDISARIKRHQTARDESWQLQETPLALAQSIHETAADSLLVIDCMTLWLNNLIHHQHDVPSSLAVLVESLAQTQAAVIMVSHELGLAPHHHHKTVREFVDCHGEMNQMLAQSSQTVYIVTAGIPTRLKPKPS